MFYSRTFLVGLGLLCLTALAPATSAAMGLDVQPMQAACKSTPVPSQPLTPLPPAAHQRIPQSQAVAGHNDVAWVWLGSPTRRYPHTALGSAVHAGSVHAMVRSSAGSWHEVHYELPLHRVFEDRIPRLVDLDQDGRDEILLIESDALRGAALVVLKVSSQEPSLTEWARGPYAGSTFRWLNPVGVADFDGDGQLDIASVTTPHIGGTLTLHHVRPPELQPFAKTMDVSNHRMGALEQDLAVIVQKSGTRPTIIVPDMTRRALHALRWEAPGQWKELADLMPMPDRIDRLTPLPGGACATLSDGSTHRVTLTH